MKLRKLSKIKTLESGEGLGFRDDVRQNQVPTPARSFRGESARQDIGSPRHEPPVMEVSIC